MTSDDEFTFDDDEVDTSLEQQPYDDRTAFGTSFDEQLALREAEEREAQEREARSGAGLWRSLHYTPQKSRPQSVFSEKIHATILPV